MAFVQAPYTTMIELRMTSNYEECENTLYFNRAQTQTNTEIRALALRISNWWNTTIRPLQRDTAIMRYVYATDLETVDGYTYGEFTHTNLTGQVTGGESLPNNVSLCISFRSLYRGRSRRGRNYAIGLGTTHVTQNFVDQTPINNWIAAYEELLPGGDFDPTPYRWVTVSKWTNHVPRGIALRSNVITVTVTKNTVASMRKRLQGTL